MSVSQDGRWPWYVWLPMILALGMLIFQLGTSLGNPSSHVGYLENRVVRAQARLEKVQSEQGELEGLQAEAKQELEAIQQLFLQRVREGVPVPIDAAFVELADPSLMEQMEQAYRPLLDSPNPYHRKAAARSLIRLTEDRPEQLRALLPQILEILVDSDVNKIDRFSDMGFAPFQAETLEAAIAELQTYLDRDDPAVRVAAADLLLSITSSEPSRRDQFRRHVFDGLRPIVQAEQDEFLVSRSIRIVSQMKPNPDQWLPMLRQRIEQAPDWQRLDLASHVLQLDSQDEPTIQLLIDAILEDNLNSEYAQSILIENASEAEVRQAIQQTIKQRKLSEGKRTLLLSMLDELERKQTQPD